MVCRRNAPGSPRRVGEGRAPWLPVTALPAAVPPWKFAPAKSAPFARGVPHAAREKTPLSPQAAPMSANQRD